MKFLGLTGIWGYVAAGLAALALIAAVVVGVKKCKQIDADQDNQLVNAGVDKERSQTQGRTLENVKNAQEAVAAPTDAERQRVCDKYDRNCPKDSQ